MKYLFKLILWLYIINYGMLNLSWVMESIQKQLFIIMLYKQKKAAALRYKQGLDNAPKVTAKGRGKLAEKIIEMARQNGIPVKEDPDLVEVLSKLDLMEEIPPELYMVVAELLAYIYSLNNQKD